MRLPGSFFVSGIPVLKEIVGRDVQEQVVRDMDSNTEVGDAQVPHFQTENAHEAFTFGKLSFPPLPAARNVPPQVSSCGATAAAAAAGGAGQKINRSSKGKETYDSQEDEQEAGNPGGASSPKRMREDRPHAHTKGSNKRARVSEVCHAYKQTSRVCLRRI